MRRSARTSMSAMEPSSARRSERRGPPQPEGDGVSVHAGVRRGRRDLRPGTDHRGHRRDEGGGGGGIHRRRRRDLRRLVRRD